jgi:hypothetical protein
MSLEGGDEDEMPEGYGEFGHDVTNPIPTEGIPGSLSYLARLRAPDGAKVLYERKGSYSAEEVSPNPIDGYAISHPNGTALGMLYFSPYQKRNSVLVPKGFTLSEEKGK